MQRMTTTALLKDFITANLPKLENDHQSEAQLKRKEQLKKEADMRELRTFFFVTP